MNSTHAHITWRSSPLRRPMGRAPGGSPLENSAFAQDKGAAELAQRLPYPFSALISLPLRRNYDGGASTMVAWAGASLLLFALLVISAAANAAGDSSAWEPAAPAKDGFDWVQLTSGEWLKGKLKAMQGNEVEFDSEKLNLRHIPWKDIRQIRSSQNMAVLVKGNRTVGGTLSTEGGDLVVDGPTPVHVPLNDVISISSAESSGLGLWAAHVSLGANLRRGNQDQVDTDLTVEVRRRTPRTDFSFDYSGDFSETNNVQNSNNQRIDTGLSYRLSQYWFVRPLSVGYYRDPFQNLNARYTLVTAAGYYLYDTPRLEWTVMTGPAYQRTIFEDTPPDAAKHQSTPAWTLTSVFDDEVTSDIDVGFTYRLIVTSASAGGASQNAVLSLAVDLTKKLKLDIDFVWDRISDPQEGANGVVPKPDDYRLTIGLGYDF